MRDITDEEGKSWRVVAVDAVVAHGKPGAQLAFVAADRPDAEPLLSTITFNSQDAAAFAIRTMGENELRRRLTLARASMAV